MCRMRELNYKQELFIKEYLQCFNATKAAAAAGYSEKTARSQGQRLLTNVDVKKKIDHEMIRLRERMAEDANKAYAMLWEQLNNVEELLHRDQEAAAQLDQLNLKEIDIEKNPKKYKNSKHLKDVITAEKKMWFPYRLKHHNWLKAQEHRSHLLQDILDRAGYKATDHVEIKGSMTTHSYDFSGLSDEELAKALKSYEG